MNQRNQMLFQKILETAKNRYNNQAMLLQMEEFCEQIDIYDHVLYILVNSKELYDFLEDVNLTKFNEIATSIYQDKIEIKFINDFKEYEKIIKDENKKIKIASSKPNKNLTFATYVVGDYNKVPTELLNKIIKEDKILFNPIYIYGLTGIGKTHLINAFAIEYLKKYPDRKLKLIDAAIFSRDFINASNSNNASQKIEDFKKENSSYDVFIIEDIQFLANKEKSQEVFFSIFENLINQNKLIIITSDRFNEELNGFADRMISRFASGVTLEMKSPNEQVAGEIIRARMKEFNLTITEPAIELMMKYYTLDFRKLLGVINNLYLFSNVNSTQIIDEEELKNYITFSDGSSAKKNYYTLNLNPKSIINAVAKFYSLSTNDLVGNSRKQNVVVARVIAVHIIKEKTDLSLQSIGDSFNRTHAFVIHSLKKFDKIYKQNNDIQFALDTILKKL